MKNSHSLIISALVIGWLSGCGSTQSSELQVSPALSNLQTTTPPPSSVQTPAATTSPAQTSPLKASPQDSRSESEEAVAVIQRYYNAIDRRDYEQAYRTWQGNGSASRQTFEAFKNGFAETASTQVKLGEPGQVEGAAGSQYITVPITLLATTQSQTVQQFKGTYVLRRSLVDGTSTDQRSWHIYSAKMVQTE